MTEMVIDVVENSECGIHAAVEVRFRKGINKSDGIAYMPSLLSYLKAVSPLPNWSSVSLDETADSTLQSTVEYILVGTLSQSACQEVVIGHKSKFYFYAVNETEALAQEISLSDNADDSCVSSLQWELPCRQFDLLWENLFFDDNLKNDLLSFSSSILTLSELGVDTNIVDINRLILLHGPPGTGKTTLCKALAQRLSIRMQNSYKRTVFVEVNSHSLFSKWFSESGKLVQRLFDQIQELALDKKLLVFVLVDEVESLVMGRSSSFAGSDPSDSVRAVNAVLTQIDKIRRYPNVMVMTTSNITAALDSAFLDRTDLCRFIDNPSTTAGIQITSRAINELSRVGVISSVVDSSSYHETLHKMLSGCKVSGRFLKKAPMLAYSRSNKNQVSMDEFMDYLSKTFTECSIKSLS